jgi:hypothetical protein
MTLEETDPDRRICHRAERVITATELKHYRDLPQILHTIVDDLAKMLEKEIEKHHD